jgi:hypothetical protein
MRVPVPVAIDEKLTPSDGGRCLRCRCWLYYQRAERPKYPRHFFFCALRTAVRGAGNGVDAGRRRARRLRGALLARSRCALVPTRTGSWQSGGFCEGPDTDMAWQGMSMTMFNNSIKEKIMLKHVETQSERVTVKVTKRSRPTWFRALLHEARTGGDSGVSSFAHVGWHLGIHSSSELAYSGADQERVVEGQLDHVIGTGASRTLSRGCGGGSPTSSAPFPRGGARRLPPGSSSGCRSSGSRVHPVSH